MRNIAIIKKYWDSYYKANNLTKKESSFAKFCLEFCKNRKINHIIDVGSGNFRDSIFFLKNNFIVTSLDINSEAYNNSKKKLQKFKKKFNFICDEVQNLKKYKLNIKPDMIYARFFIHTIPEKIELQFLKWAYRSLKKDRFFCIETRINLDNEIVKYSKKSLSNNSYEFEKGHFRRLIDTDNFIARIIKLNFKIRYLNISRNFSKIKLNDRIDNPILLRLIVCK